MKKQLKLGNFFKYSSALVTVVSVTFFINNIVLAQGWIGPSQDPPGGNTPGVIYNIPVTGPIVPADAQSADIQIAGDVVADNLIASSVFANLCLPNSSADPSIVCQTTWAEGGGLFWQADAAQEIIYFNEEGNVEHSSVWISDNFTTQDTGRAVLSVRGIGVGALPGPTDDDSFIELISEYANHNDLVWGDDQFTNFNIKFNYHDQDANSSDKTVATFLPDGNVGLGVTDPLANLQIGPLEPTRATFGSKEVPELLISTASGPDSVARFEFTGLNRSMIIAFCDDSDSGVDCTAIPNGANPPVDAGDGLSFWPVASDKSGPEAMIITNSAQVGIGDTAPDNGLLLDVEGNIGAVQYCDQDGLNCFDPVDAGGGTGFWIDNGTNISNTNDGDVLSTGDFLVSGPVGKFRSDTIDGSDNAQMHFTGGGDNGPTRGADIRMLGNEFAIFNGDMLLSVGDGDGAGNLGDFLFIGGGSTIMTIENGGNVGIGIGIPAEALDVVGNIQTFGNFLVENPGGLFANTSDGGDSSWVEIGGAGGTGPDRGAGIQMFGNEVSTLGLYGDMVLTAGDGNGGLNLGDMYFNLGGSTRVRLLNTGEVGIGDETPDAGLLLDVEGNIGATQYCDQDGLNCFLPTNVGGSSFWQADATQEIIYFNEEGNVEHSSVWISDNFTTQDTGRATLSVRGVGVGALPGPIDDDSFIELVSEYLPGNIHNDLVWGDDQFTKLNIKFNYHDQDAASSDKTVATFLPDGNVGINTTNPLDRFSVSNAFNVDPGGWINLWLNAYWDEGANNRVEFSSFDGGFNYAAGLSLDYATGALHLKTSTNQGNAGDPVSWNSNQLVLDSNGNVGIGVASPVSKLDIVANPGAPSGLRGLSMVLDPGVTDPSYVSYAGYFRNNNTIGGPIGLEGYASGDGTNGKGVQGWGSDYGVGGIGLSSGIGVYGIGDSGVEGWGQGLVGWGGRFFGGINFGAPNSPSTSIGAIEERFGWANIGSNYYYDGTWEKMDPAFVEAGANLRMKGFDAGLGNSQFIFRTVDADGTNVQDIVEIGTDGSIFNTDLTLANITGSTQCLQVDSSGKILGTGSACGSGGGGVTQIVAGTGVTISPIGGTGAVTINATESGDISDVEDIVDVSGLVTWNTVRTNARSTHITISANIQSAVGATSYLELQRPGGGAWIQYAQFEKAGGSGYGYYQHVSASVGSGWSYRFTSTNAAGSGVINIFETQFQ